MGENLGHVWSTAQIGEEDGGFNTRINSWFNEVQIYSFGSAFSPKTGHYSQVSFSFIFFWILFYFMKKRIENKNRKYKSKGIYVILRIIRKIYL